MATVGQRPPAATPSPRRSPRPSSTVAFETLLANLSSRFVNLPSDEVDPEIEDALGRVCSCLDVDLAVLWQWSASDRSVVAPTHAHPSGSEGLRPSSRSRNSIPGRSLRCIMLPDDGRERWILSRGRPPSSPSGQPGRLTGVSIDLTERKRAEEALRPSESRLASGAELAGLGFYEVDFVARDP